MKQTMRMYFILFCLTLAIAASASSAFANVAANTQIINSADLAYNDGTGLKHATAAVTVTVALVPSATIIALGGPQSTSYNGAGTLLTDSFTITATANGPDTYNLGSAVTASTNTGGTTAPTATPTAGSVALGATVTALGSTTTVIVVPADGTSNGNVNGIQAGDTVVINGDQRTVQSVTDNAAGTSTIVLASALTSAPGAGVVVGQQKVVTVNVTAGGPLATPGVNATVSANLTVTSQTLGTVTVTSGSVLNTYTSGVASLTKYVRNATNASGTGAPFAYGGNNYYLAGVTAKPNEVLEYLLVATNSGAGAVTASAITDLVPVDYITLKLGAYGGAGKDVTYVDDLNATSQLTAAGDGDAATYNAIFDVTQNAAKGKITVNVGTGATSGAGVSIPAGANVKVLYQVTVKP